MSLELRHSISFPCRVDRDDVQGLVALMNESAPTTVMVRFGSEEDYEGPTDLVKLLEQRRYDDRLHKLTLTNAHVQVHLTDRLFTNVVIFSDETGVSLAASAFKILKRCRSLWLLPGNLFLLATVISFVLFVIHGVRWIEHKTKVEKPKSAAVAAPPAAAPGPAPRAAPERVVYTAPDPRPSKWWRPYLNRAGIFVFFILPFLIWPDLLSAILAPFTALHRHVWTRIFPSLWFDFPSMKRFYWGGLIWRVLLDLGTVAGIVLL